MPNITLSYTQANLDRILAAMKGPISPEEGADAITVGQVQDYLASTIAAFVEKFDESAHMKTRSATRLERS
jgi:hypothetical protein